MAVSELAVLLHPRVRTLRPSPTLAINEKSARLARAGRPIYTLGLGQSPFPIPASVVRALQANAFQKDYLPVRGLPALRAAVAEFHQRVQGLPATAEDILIGPGSKELIFLAQLVYQADLVIPAPSWVSYEPQARLLGLNVHWIQTSRENGWRLMPEDLENLGQDGASPRLLILNYPTNPTGLSYDATHLATLATIARREKLLIVADEIYGELHHTGRHASIAQFYPEGTIVSNGLSKWCGAGGWRLGTFCFPTSLRWLLDAMADVASETFSAVAAPIQHAAITAFARNDEIENYLLHTRRILRGLGRAVSSHLCAAGIDTAAPDGAFYLFPDFARRLAPRRAKGLTTCAEFCDQLLAEIGVALLPGSDFGRPADEFTCRLAYVDFDGGTCLTAASQVPLDQELGDELLRKHCHKVLTAVDLIIDWLN